MRKIYLASNSKARRELLKKMGVRFVVMPSKAKEIKKASGSSYVKLVKANALAKAKEVAGRLRSGLIIAADTIMVQDKRIFGKPKDLSDAKKMLKRLSRAKQSVYTGVAVIDKDSGKKIVDYEKTHVFMHKLSDNEIDAYFKEVSPLDKAGSFDIQGKGGLFIRKIDGCFYNVVGLPLKKLKKMLKQIGVVLNVLLFCFIAAGCSSEYNIVTGEQESYIYSTDKEIAIGQSIAKAVQKEYEAYDDPLVQKRVEDIGKKIVAVCDRKEITYHFMVLDDDEVNAISLPGGYVYINKGLIEKVANDDELAGVLAHEIGHIVARHSIKKLQAVQGYTVLRLLVMAAPKSGQVGTAADAAFTELLLGYSREDELLADQLGARYARLAGYDPKAMINFLKKLQEINRRKPAQPRSYYKTHPYVPDRVREVKKEIGEEIDFDDYINTEQVPHK
jgi:MAF protein